MAEGSGKWNNSILYAEAAQQKSAQIKSLTKLGQAALLTNRWEKNPISKWTIFSFQQWQSRCFSERGFAAPFLSLFWEIQTGCWGFVLSMVWDIPVVTQGHLSWLCPLPVSGWGARKGSVQALLSWNWNIPVLSALLSAQIQNTALCWILGGKLTLLQPKL